MARQFLPRGLFTRGDSNSRYTSPFIRTRALNPNLPPEALAAAGSPVSVGSPVDLAAPELDPANVSPALFISPNAVPIKNELLYGNFNNLQLVITAASVRVLGKPPIGSRRTYLFIVNTGLVNQIFVAFGGDANVNSGVPILPNFGFIELSDVIPQDNIYIIGAAASTGVLVYCNDVSGSSESA